MGCLSSGILQIDLSTPFNIQILMFCSQRFWYRLQVDLKSTALSDVTCDFNENWINDIWPDVYHFTNLVYFYQHKNEDERLKPSIKRKRKWMFLTLISQWTIKRYILFKLTEWIDKVGLIVKGLSHAVLRDYIIPKSIMNHGLCITGRKEHNPWLCPLWWVD